MCAAPAHSVEKAGAALARFRKLILSLKYPISPRIVYSHSLVNTNAQTCCPFLLVCRDFEHLHHYQFIVKTVNCTK